MYQVVGYDPYSGQAVYGEVMGYSGVMGDADMDVVGRHPHALARHPAHGHRMMPIPHRPDWRNQLAPGVIQPDEGMVPLPLVGQAGAPAGTFTATIPSITFQGQLQKPYRAERLLVSVVRTGATAVGRLLTQLFVGTDLQQAEIAGWDAELVGQATAFGTRLTAKSAEPGVFIRTVVTLSTGLTGTDTIFATMMFLGRVIH
jgi:hypothetical protein